MKKLCVFLAIVFSVACAPERLCPETSEAAVESVLHTGCQREEVRKRNIEPFTSQPLKTFKPLTRKLCFNGKHQPLNQQGLFLKTRRLLI